MFGMKFIKKGFPTKNFMGKLKAHIIKRSLSRQTVQNPSRLMNLGVMDFVLRNRKKEKIPSHMEFNIFKILKLSFTLDVLIS